IGNEKSVINGALNANGQVWILNSNGVLFGKNASINTSGILATTAQLSDQDFQNGTYNFKDTTANSVINEGTITIENGGSVILASNEVKNTGSIKAIKGKIHLVGADSYSLNLNGNSLVNLKVEKGVLDALVENSGTILADGGEIYLTTNAVDELLKGVVNNTGIIEANSIDDLTGYVELFAHGGTAQIGGEINAKDGFVETSGKYFDFLGADIQAGEWLIDPVNVTIDSTLASAIASALVSGDVIISTDGSNIPDTSSNQNDGEGNIYVNSAINWISNTLTLSATNNIFINESLSATYIPPFFVGQTVPAAAKLQLFYGQGAVNSNNESNYYVNAPINLNQGSEFSTKLGSDGAVIDWTIIKNLSELQNINNDLTNNYVLGADIDASDTFSWDNGKGFEPIGDDTTKFIGKFDGLGHVIRNLIITRGNETDVGLFSAIEGKVQNIGLEDVYIIGGKNVGGLVGSMHTNSSVVNSYTTGTIKGEEYIFDGDESRNSENIGGLIGVIHSGASEVKNSFSLVDVTGRKSIGGLIGLTESGTKVSNSYAQGEVELFSTNSGSYPYRAGGLIGEAKGTIENSYATGNVQGQDGNGSLVGGLVGISEAVIKNSYATGTVNGTANTGGLVGANKGTISSSYSTGEVSSGNEHIGGLVGINEGGIISSSYSTGTVSGSQSIGGLVGYNRQGTISSSYSTGTVSGNYRVAGLVGHNYEGDVTNSYWDTQTSGLSTSAQGEGKTTSELQNIDTFKQAGWDIVGDESLAPNNYPVLVTKNGVTRWTMYEGELNQGSDQGEKPTPTIQTPTTQNNDIQKVITTIVNKKEVDVEIPKNIEVKTNTPQLEIVKPKTPQMQQTTTTLAKNIGLENSNINIVSKTDSGENANTIVTLGEIKTAMQEQPSGDTNSNLVTQEVRVPLSKNSIVDLVNGGVNLPSGVEQQFFVVGDEN
uniref:GLUG motif-containing protein n=1 Tax=Arcobacter sp. LA11 TaxID=1898176 RepID=UPI0009329CE8